MSNETKLVFLAAFLATLAAATCSRMDGNWNDNSVECVKVRGIWQSPSGITPGWCKK